MILDQFLSQPEATSTDTATSLPAQQPEPSAAGPEEPKTGTAVGFETVEPDSASSVSVVNLGGPDEQENVLAIVPPLDATQHLQRLQHVCHLLRRSRQPVCAVNGILTLLPFQMMQAQPEEVEELERAVKSDLLTVHREVEVRCPVTALVVGLEHERGFSELVRRVGPDRAATQRFGKGYDVRCLVEREGLAAFCEHVCGAFEDWVHSLFREQRALTRPGNTRLYGLLCKVRCNLKTRLTEIMTRAFGYDSRELPNDDPFLFSGCYFAATGDKPDRQAFIRGVVDKLVQEQEYVEWSKKAAAANRRYRWLAIAGICCSALLIVSLTAMIVQLAI
jgi:hypothetical protein